MRLGTTEILIVLGLVVLFFGGQKIPQLMRGIGQGMGEFRKGVKEGKESAGDE
jgi:sec-independent protein translocase protein TatA